MNSRTNKGWALLLVLLGTVVWTPRLWAQAAPAADTDAETKATAQTEAAEVDGENAEAEENGDQRELMRKIADQAAPYLVTVATRWKEDKGESPGEDYEVRRGIDTKMSSEEMGLVLDPSKGWVLTQDSDYETRFIESVKGITSDGKEFPLQPHGFYLDLPAMVCRSDAWPGVKEPLVWFDGDLEIPSGLHLAQLSRARLGWNVTVWLGGGGGQTGLASDRKTDEEWTVPTACGLIVDNEVRPLGFRLPPLASLTSDRFPWRGADLAKAPLVTFEDFDKAKAERLSRFGQFVHEVKIVYRQPEEGEENLEFEGEDRTSLTQHYYGYAVSPRRIVVPVRLDKIYIQRFKKITVRFNGHEVAAKFLGAYQDFGGFMVETEEAESPAVLPRESAPVPDTNRAVLTYVAERKFGGRRDTVWYNRITGYQREYKDEQWPATRNSLTRGTLVMDFDGRPIGLALIERRPEEEKKGDTRQDWRYRGSDNAVKLYRMDKLAAAFADPEAHFDPNLRPTDEREEKRLVWLGVETQPVTAELAEMLDEMAGGDAIQKLTRRGEIGLRVTYVYAGSPAEKAGIKPGTVLLEIKEEGKDDPIELKPFDGGYGYRRYGRYGSSMGSENNRSNYLTKLLTRLGPGTKVTLAYLDGTEKKNRDFALEWAPYDYSSAAKYKDEKSGLTVKDLTYDIRAYLHLDAEQPGVICAKIEPGEKAAVAQIQPSVILTELNGRPIKDVEDYQKRMEEIQNGSNGGVADIRLLWMGKSRMVRLQFP
ncbi:MAG: hypothetical protein JXL80_08550 [Planctomycetes bacterium]|nr:hypothetical protein [Planctomycetota bacterium]